MALDFFAGCVGGAAGVIVGHPLDTVKVRLQTQSPTNLKYRGTYHCLSTIIKQESVSGLYKGISSPLVGVAGVNAIIFGVYGALRPYVSGSPGNDSLSAHFLAGSISGAVQSVVASPMELVKTRMQINEDSGGNRKVGPVEVLRGIYQNEGGLFRGVFKGWGITLGREVPGFGFYFASYEALTRFGDGQVSTLGMLMAGGMAGVISWIVTFPIDVVKTRLQCDNRGKYTGVIDCIRKTYSTEGHRAFSRGLMSTVIRAFPTNAATFTVVTWIMRFSGETPEDNVQNSKQYLDELLQGTTKLQEKFEDTLRLKMPQHLFLGNSLTSGSLAAQCAASAQRYADRTQIYFNFYQSLQQQAEQATRANDVADSEEGETEECCVGVEKKIHVSFLHEKLAINLYDNEMSISNSSGPRENCGNSTQELLSSSQQPEQPNQEKVTASRGSKMDGSVQVGTGMTHNSNDCGLETDSRTGDTNAVLHNNHIPSTSKSPPSVITNENHFERKTTNAEIVVAVSCAVTESPLRITNAAAAAGRTSNVVKERGHERQYNSLNDTNATVVVSTSSLIQENEEFSHEAGLLPVQAKKSEIVTAMTLPINDEVDNDLEIETGATGSRKNAFEYLNSTDVEHDVEKDTTTTTALSSRDLTYLSQSLDIPVHILKAASLQHQYNSDTTITGCTNNGANKVQVTPTPAATLTRSRNAPTANVTNNSTTSSMNTTQAWKKYCKTPALNLCKCYEDHCVCYF